MWLRRFEKARLRLYRLSILISTATLGTVIAAAVLGQAVEPVSDVLPTLVGFFTPGFPANLLDLATKFPWAAGIVVFALIVIVATSRRVQLDENEYAFQRWRCIYDASGGEQPSPVSEPQPLVKMICSTASIVSSLLLLATAALGLIVVAFGICHLCSACTFADRLVPVPDQSVTKGADRNASSCCADIVGARLLGGGDKKRVMIIASNKRNETGLLLEAGQTYTAKYVSHRNWMDGDFEAHPSGVEYDGLTRLLTWGMEWLRPYPEGEWFQVVGRIDRSREVFAVLGTSDEATPYEFVAPEDGELVLLVNDVHYGNNSGWLSIEIGR